MERKEIRNIYLELIGENETLLARLKRQQLIISISRLVVFVAGLLLVFPVFSISVAMGVAEILIFAVLFLLLIKQYIRLSERIRFTDNLISINKSEINALDGNFSSFDGGSKWKNTGHDFSNDIDLFGDDSLFRYLNRTVTGYGREILAGWLSDPYAFRELIKARQEAVRELSPIIKWRQEFIAHGLGKPLEKEDAESLRKWIEGEEKFLSGPFLKEAVTISPVLTTGLLILALFSLVPFNLFGMFFILNLALTGMYIKKTSRIHSMVSRKYIFLSSFEKLITAVGNEKFQSQIMVEASGKLFSAEVSAALKIKELSRIIQAFDSRLNLFAGLILNGLILWDFKCIARLERWKHTTVMQLSLWLETIGQTDALISLSNHAFNNPDYVFPEISGDDPVIEASDLGHPLIDRKTRICNDFSVERKGRICIVTGANMAGKSTILRTIAANMILAMTGTTVCAARFKFKPVSLFSSMRTTDSLSGSESYFYAELKRLKILKERLETEDDLFFILDEILKGTNSEDKSTGSKKFLAKMAERNGTGIIATHDISLGEMEKEFPGKIFNKCFEVEIRGESLIFDYKLRDGITRHMNAGILMKQMGII